MKPSGCWLTLSIFILAFLAVVGFHLGDFGGMAVTFILGSALFISANVWMQAYYHEKFGRYPFEKANLTRHSKDGKL